jgi:hypothetical protein
VTHSTEKIYFWAMQRFSVLFILILALWPAGQSKAEVLSPAASISILTFGPHHEVYAIWGHTAIRVKDPVLRIDKVYNYGTFDFSTPNFTLKFIRGKLDYALSIQRYHRVVRAYKEEQRWIKEQILNLTQAERQRLYDLLEENYLEENRYYKYDFLFDNCATRPLEMIVKSTHDSISFGKTIPLSYRNILDEHLLHNPWLDFGIDLIIGALADVMATPEQQMFMPVYILNYFRHATRTGESTQALVARESTIAEEGNIRWPVVPFFLHPLSIFTILLVLEIILLYLSLRKKRILARPYDIFWFSLIFLGSVLILFMWFGTDHVPTRNNWNIGWMNPVFLLLLPLFNPVIRTWAAKTLFIILALFLLSWLFVPQQFHLAVLPIIGILGIKSYKYGFLFRKKTSNQ